MFEYWILCLFITIGYNYLCLSYIGVCYFFTYIQNIRNTTPVFRILYCKCRVKDNVPNSDRLLAHHLQYTVRDLFRNSLTTSTEQKKWRGVITNLNKRKPLT